MGREPLPMRGNIQRLPLTSVVAAERGLPRPLCFHWSDTWQLVINTGTTVDQRCIASWRAQVDAQMVRRYARHFRCAATRPSATSMDEKSC